MAGWKFFPSGEGRQVASESLDYAVQNEHDLNETHRRALADKRDIDKSQDFNKAQKQIAKAQADEDLSEIAELLKHAALKLSWELHQKWKRKK